MTTKAQLEDQLAIAKAINEELRETVDGLRKTAGEAAKAIEGQRRSINLFKAEALQAATTIAEMHGYITRTLEDDTVREPAPQPAGLLSDEQRANMVERLNRDHRVRDQPMTRRNGPPSMHPFQIIRGDCQTADSLFGDSDRRSTMKIVVPPIPWLDR